MDKQSFIRERGVLGDRNSPEYREAEREYSRLYAKQWQQENRNKYKTVKLVFPVEDYRRVANHAKKQELPLATMIKRVVLDYTRQTVYVPPNEYLQEATIEINRIGTLINNQTRHVHTVRRLSEQDYQFLLDQVADMRETLNRIYSRPIPLKQVLIDALKKGGESTRKEIQEILTFYDSTHDN